MIDLVNADWTSNAAILVAAAAVIVWTGIRLAAIGDRLADRLGLGEAITGMIFMGFVTALPGLSASVTAALENRPAMAISNAIGGIAIQTTFLACADIAHRKANLEHAAASIEIMIQTAVLILLLSLVLLALSGPDAAIVHVHPMTLVLFLSAGVGFWLVYQSRRKPMWKPRVTSATVEDIPAQEHLQMPLLKMLVVFALHALLITAAGSVVAHTAGAITDQTNLNEALAGALLSGVATSLPELVTTIAAVRRGALTLAVGDIVGGNIFDVLFVFAADLVYYSGSLYHAAGVGIREFYLVGLAITLNAILLLGLLYRQRTGPGNIGFESVLMVVVYLGGVSVLIMFE